MSDKYFYTIVQVTLAILLALAVGYTYFSVKDTPFNVAKEKK